MLRTISAIITGLSPAVATYLFKLLVDNIFSFMMTESLLIIVYLLLFELCVSVVTKYIGKKTDLTYDLFRNELKFDLYKKTVEMDYEILSNPETMDKKELALVAVNMNFGTKYIDCMFSLVSALISIISLFYILSVVSWWVVAIVAVIVLLRVITILIQKKVVYNTQIDMAPINKRISYYMQVMGDSNYANEMRMHPIASWLIKKYHKTVIEIYNLYTKLNNFNFRSNLFLRSLTIIEQSLYYVFLTLQVIYHGLSYADFSMFLSAINSLSTQITSVFRNIIEVIDNALYVNAYRDFMEIKNNIAVSNVGIRACQIEDGEMIYSIDNISFKYPGSNQYIFKNLSIRIEPKKLYVVVGRNGAGKSTLCKLICRLYDIENGHIRFNGVDIREIEYSSYRLQIGIVFQDYKYYEMTIAENIAMDFYDATDTVRNKIMRCLEIVGLKEKILSLPKGIDTSIGRLFDENGVLLSGGEMQKIALAKVIFMDSPVVILDEPSSSMDAVAENDLIETVINATKEKTVFYISHRLSVAKYAYKVIFVDDGKISGYGSHESLMESNTKYAEMYNSQARHYI